MGNSKIIIAVVVGIIVVKLVAIHFYLRKKMDESEINQNNNQENNPDKNIKKDD